MAFAPCPVVFTSLEGDNRFTQFLNHMHSTALNSHDYRNGGE